MRIAVAEPFQQVAILAAAAAERARARAIGGLPHKGQVLRRGRHGRPTWRARGPARKVDRAADLAPSAPIQSGRGSRRSPPGAAVSVGRADRRPGAAQQGARLERRAVARRVRSARRGARGRTIWTKPKPLIAVRSNGWGKIGVEDRRRSAARSALPRRVGKSIPIDPPMSSRRIARAAAQRRHLRQLVGHQPAVDVDHGHRRGRLDPEFAAVEADDAAARLLEQIVPAVDRGRAVPRPAAGRGAGRLCVGAAGERRASTVRSRPAPRGSLRSSAPRLR